MLDSSSCRSTLHTSRLCFSGARAHNQHIHCRLLTLALLFALRNLFGPAIALLRKELGKPATAGLVDPSTDMVQALNRFLDWLVMARQTMIPVVDIPQL